MLRRTASLRSPRPVPNLVKVARFPLALALLLPLVTAVACERAPDRHVEDAGVLTDTGGIATGGTTVNDTVPVRPGHPRTP